MGYYNDVRALVYGPTKRINAMIAKHAMQSSFNVFESWLKDNIEIGSRDEGITMVDLSLMEVKWAPAHDSAARAWINFADLIHDDIADGEVAYEFVRIGEEIDDIERECTGPHNDYLWVSRSITCDF